jgi:hypothetical protein
MFAQNTLAVAAVVSTFRRGRFGRVELLHLEVLVYSKRLIPKTIPCPIRLVPTVFLQFEKLLYLLLPLMELHLDNSLTAECH